MGLNLRQRETLKLMGVQTWSLRRRTVGYQQDIEPVTSEMMNEVTEQRPVYETTALPLKVLVKSTPAAESDELLQEIDEEPEFSDLLRDGEWGKLKLQVSQCQQCDLHTTRTQTVFGVGNECADWMIIGEAPGAEEDKKGEPFVGRAGQLLNNMLRAIGLSREQVFIANILKCRPPNNRDPRPEEVLSCEHYLRQQIAMIQPKIILAVGRVAAQNLLKINTPIGKMRGQKYILMGTHIPVVVTYHPAYLLRSPKEKRKTWQDLCAAQKLYRELV